MELSESSEKNLADAGFCNLGIAGHPFDFCSNIAFSSFHLYLILVDLLQKSGFEFEFQIVDGRNQIKAESKASLPLSITLAQNRTDLSFAITCSI